MARIPSAKQKNHIFLNGLLQILVELKAIGRWNVFAEPSMAG